MCVRNVVPSSLFFLSGCLFTAVNVVVHYLSKPVCHADKMFSAVNVVVHYLSKPSCHSDKMFSTLSFIKCGFFASLHFHFSAYKKRMRTAPLSPCTLAKK